MKYLLLFPLVLLSRTALSTVTVIDLLTNPALFEPTVECAPEVPGPTRSCAGALCKEHRPAFPAVVTNDELDKLFVQAPKITAEEEAILRDFVKRNVDLNLQILRAFEGLSEADLNRNAMNRYSVDFVYGFVNNYLAANCRPTTVMQKGKPLTHSLTCNSKQNILAVKKTREATTLTEMKENLELNLIAGLLDPTADKKRIFDKATALDLQIRGMTVSEARNARQQELLLRGIANYDSYDYVKKVQFIKALSELDQQNRQPTNEQLKEMVDFFDAYTKSPDLKKSLTALRKKFEDPAFIRNAVASLKVELALTKNFPTPQDVENLKTTMAQTKDSILAYMSGKRNPAQTFRMSEESLGRYGEELMQRLEVRVNLQGVTAEMLKETPADAVTSQDRIMAAMARANPEEAYPLAGVNLGSRVSIVTDHFRPSLGKTWDDPSFEASEIQVSLFSLKDPAHGQQILTHEMGHHLHDLQKQKKLSAGTASALEKAQSCIKARYKGFKKNGVDAGEFYLAEEFADEFMFAVLPASPQISSCSYLTGSGDLEAATALVPLTTPGTHPSAFLRALNQVKRARALPPVCEKILTANLKNYEYKPCL